jgi:vacuolar-type H+-ATPase subunit C/Vma6
MSPSASVFGQGYAYGFGRIGVLQEYLLTQQDVERLLAARDETALHKAITEMKISTHVEYATDPHRFINNLEQWLQREITALVPEGKRRIFDILWVKDDASLLAYLLKKHHGFTSDLSAEPVIGASAFGTDELRTLVETGTNPALPDELTAFVRGIRDAKDVSPQMIDTAVAQFVVEHQNRMARESGSESIRRYVRHHIDLQNIRTARRLSADERPADHLLRGGEIDIERFSMEPHALVELIRKSSLPNSLIDSLLDAIGGDESSILLERGLARAIAHDIAVMRDHVLTVDPIFAFAAIYQSQLRLLRTVLVAKSAGLSAEEAHKLLPPFLSASPFAS